MEDNQIFRIALITVILGLTGMMLLGNKIMPEEVKIKDINKGMIDQDVSIEGVVKDMSASSRSNTYFLQVIDGTGNTTVVVFDTTALGLSKYNLTPQSFVNHRVKINGTVQQYNGNMELILKDANSIKILV